MSRTERTPVVIGTSWKMTKTLAEAASWVDAVLGAGIPAGVEVFVLPPHTALASVRAQVPGDSALRIGAQDAHWASDGAVTGAVSMGMVRDAGATIVEVGHAERRHLFGETDETVALKVAAALSQGLTPLVCVGEPAEVRRRGAEVHHVVTQLRAALSRVDPGQSAPVYVAYEPVWAIGDGGSAASPSEIVPVVEAVRDTVTGTGVEDRSVVVLYGGGVTPSNAAELLACGVDGLFLGRAGWSADQFTEVLDSTHTIPSPTSV